MRWISEKTEFENVLKNAYTCVYIDSGREPTHLTKFIFDDSIIMTRAFRELLNRFMKLSNDDRVNYVVLRPDPVYYFCHFFHRYPCVEIKDDDPMEAYFQGLNEDPGNSPADAIGINWWETVIVPTSRKWFVHALRDDDESGGHLWIPEPWIKSTLEAYPFLRDGG
jgi:hypothetical protein